MRTIYGELIKKQREKMGMSLPELADRCLIKEEYLRMAEEGEPVLGRTDLVIICNVLEISSVALEDGRLVKKPGMPELEGLIEKLQEKVDELQESIKEMKAAAASLTIITQAKALELRDSGPEAGRERSAEKEEAVRPEAEAKEQIPEKAKTEEAKMQGSSL